MSIRSFRKAVVGAALIGAAAAGGAFAASAIGSGSGNAGVSTATEVQTLVEDETGTTVAGDTETESTDTRGPKGPRTNNGITEEPLTGDALAQATAAAEAAVPDGTIERVETDADGAVYEAHMTKADGTRVTVKLNADFTVASIEEGHRGGHGHHGRKGGRDGCDDEAATDGASTDSSTTETTTAS